MLAWFWSAFRASGEFGHSTFDMQRSSPMKLIVAPSLTVWAISAARDGRIIPAVSAASVRHELIGQINFWIPGTE
jgi:hypothetical protein